MDEARTAQQHLARLYYLATFLREVEPEDKEYKPLDTMEKGNWIYKERFKAFPFEYFGVIWNPTADPPEERVEGSAPDCLRDIWSDLTDGLHEWDTGHRQHAEWTWQHMFFHWGHHITELLYPLHVGIFSADEAM